MAKKTTKAAPEVKITDETNGVPDEVTTDAAPSADETVTADAPPVITPDVTDESDATQVSDAAEDTAPDSTDEPTDKDVPPVEVVPPAVEPTPPKEESAVLPHHKAFFGQYLSLMQERKTENSIKALNNCIKTVLASKSEQQYIDLVDMFREAKDVLSHKTVLQSAATLPSADRARLEVMIVILTTLANRTKIAISLDTARNVIKDNDFVDFVAKRMSTM